MRNKAGRFNNFMTVAVLIFFCSAMLSGCTTLRRKFVRKGNNKEIKEEFIPVLEPVEYKRVETSVLDSYRSHYAMVKAYLNDAYAAFGSKDSSDKREKYLLGQITAHLRGMADLLSKTRKIEAEAVAARLDEIIKEFEKPAGLRRYDLIKTAVRKVETDIRRTLKPDMVKEFIVTQ